MGATRCTRCNIRQPLRNGTACCTQVLEATASTGWTLIGTNDATKMFKKDELSGVPVVMGSGLIDAPVEARFVGL